MRLLFEMKERGMRIIEDPSTFFLQARDTVLSGTALVMSMESQRPFVVEVQALVTRTFLAFPRRTALGFDANRLHLLIAVMEKPVIQLVGRVPPGAVGVYSLEYFLW